MKRRICFVEDDPKLVKSFDQALAGVSDSWDTTFVNSANAALKAMAAQPFDAVVTKMRLPGVSGAKLLQEVGRLYPRTVRCIQGDVADRELIINCIGGSHQFIPGPQNPQDLINTVQRSLALDSWLSSDQLRTIVPKLRRLPSLPSAYFAVLKQVESPNAGAKAIGDCIGHDPAMTAKLLQMANSAAFGIEQKVIDVVTAVSLLGVETVKSLVLCLQVFTQNDEARQAGVSFDRLWTHSLAVARISRDIVLAETKDARKANDAFTAGLLHDVGRIVLASNLPQEYAGVIAKARENKRLLHEEEAAQLGVTHAQVGAYLLGIWGMPAPLVEAVALHHTPNDTATKEFSLLTATHVANVLAHEKGTVIDDVPAPTLDLAYLNALNLAEKADIWRKSVVVEKKSPTPEEQPAPASNGHVTARLEKAESAPARPKPAPATKIIAPPPVVTARSGSSHDARPVVGWVAIGAMAVIAVALCWWFVHPKHSTDLQASARAGQASAAPTPAPAPQPAADPTPQRQPEISPFDSIKLQAIFYRPTNPSVVINGKTLGLGERVNGVEVVFIGQTNVVLAYRNERKIFRMKK